MFISFVVSTLASPALATDFNNVTYHRCYDGDTCTFTIPGVHPLFGEKISVRIAVMETAEVLVEVYTPGVMSAGLSSPLFWAGMLLALAAGFLAAFPVNYVLVGKGIRHHH